MGEVGIVARPALAVHARVRGGPCVDGGPGVVQGGGNVLGGGLEPTRTCRTFAAAVELDHDSRHHIANVPTSSITYHTVQPHLCARLFEVRRVGVDAADEDAAAGEHEHKPAHLDTVPVQRNQYHEDSG